MRLFAIALLFVCVSAGATKPAVVTVAELFANAEYVVRASITSKGNVLAGAPECGSRYEARVNETYKGKTGSPISFGYVNGLRRGSEYVLFLNKPGTPYVRLMSTNSRSEQIGADIWKRCSPMQRDPQIMQGSVGALRVRTGGPFGSERAIAFMSGLAVPKHLRVRSDSTDRYVTWARGIDFAEYLRALAVAPN
jgi:hypothetical protein